LTTSFSSSYSLFITEDCWETDCDTPELFLVSITLTAFREGQREVTPNELTKSFGRRDRIMKNNGRKIFFAVVFAVLASLPFTAMAVAITSRR
jgi:hypothetical protein